jgi:hypothetical protein
MMPGDTRRFTAFISYSHADADAASKLQRRLERYRLPKRIAQARANSSQALGPIFRDREDLAVAASLSDAIRDAITRAEALIVLCSPDAVSSPWVAAEIDLFRAHHPDKPIFAVLLSGDPATSFPAILTANGNEPLAADLRPNGDGPQLGFLKIVAGIAGVSLDTLIQRDAQRRIRRVTAITAGALAAMLVMGIMTTYALQARDEAARQRASAEGLVEYMLTDLRGKLRAVGRPEIMGAVNARALEHYRSQGDLASLPNDSLERRARVLHAMGEDYGNSNKPDQAFVRFSDAHAVTKALLDREPRNPDRIFAHAQSEYWLGQAAWRKRDRKTTTRYWSAYLNGARKLLEVDKNKARANLEMGYALGNLCELYLNENFDIDRAIEHCKESIVYEKKAAAVKPDDVEIAMALANRYGWLADALLAKGSLAEARAARSAEQAAVDVLVAKDPKNFELRFRQLWPQFGKILIEIEAGPNRASAKQLSKMADKIAILSAEAPDNSEVKRAWLRALYLRTKTLAEVDRSAALQSLAETKRLFGQLGRTQSQRDALAGFAKAVVELEQELDKEGKSNG